MILKDIVYLAWAVFYRFVAFFARKLTKWKDDEVYICFFSPYFGGNEKPVALYMKEHQKDIERRTGKKIFLYFMSENRNQTRFAREYGIDAYWHHDPAAIPLLAKTKIFVTTHGEGLPISRRKYFLDFVQDLLSQMSYKFNFKRKIQPSYGESVAKRVELWHGVGFKDVLAEEFLDYGTLVPPDILCVTSGFIKNWYIDRVKFDERIFRITGYPRNDVFFKKVDKNKILRKLNLPGDRKIILFAPTWEQDFKSEGTKNIFFWEPNQVLSSLINLLEEVNANLIIRTHWMWRGKLEEDILKVIERHPNVVYAPMEDYPDTSELLSITDVLITDWSSIAIDFMLSKKPIIFIDVPDPFHGNFCLGPDDRAGKVAKNLDELIKLIREAIRNREDFLKIYSKNLEKVLDKAFLHKDGKATERVITAIEELMHQI